MTNYSGLRLHDVVLDVLSPVAQSDGPVLGIVRVTYHTSIRFTSYFGNCVC